MAVGVFEKRAAQWAARRGWKRLSESVFPVVATALASCFVDSCAATDTHLGSGFGDTLSSKAAGHDELADLVEILVCAHLSGRAEELAIDLQSAMSPDQTDFSGVDCVTFFIELADCLTRNVREAAAKSGPLTQWYVLAQNDTTLSQMRDSVALLEEVTAVVHELQRAVPGAALPPRLVRPPLTNVRGRSEFEFVGTGLLADQTVAG